MSRSNDQLLRWRSLLAVVGPGLAVMLADTESGSVITVAQSGAQWGYRLLLLQFLLIVPLYMVQELAARLALGTGRGFLELVRQHFGRGPARLALSTLAVSCLGSVVTQLSGLAGIGELFGIPAWQTIVVLATAILVMVTTGSYRAVERAVVLLGLFELAFVFVAWRAHPDGDQVLQQLLEVPLSEPGYLYLVAANLGTCVMPWAVVYQQSAMIDKGLGIEHLRLTRLDVLIGAVICQGVTAALLIAAAATFGQLPGASLESVPQIALAFTAVLGHDVGRIVFAAGVGSGSLVAVILVCLAAAWAVGEVTGVRHSLEQHPLQAPWFYAAFATLLVASGALVASGVNLVRLAIAVGVINALLMPVVLCLLFLLARSELSGSQRLTGAYAVTAGLIFGAIAALGIYAGLVGAFG